MIQLKKIKKFNNNIHLRNLSKLYFYNNPSIHVIPIFK